MIFYSAYLNLGGDRNHVLHKRNVTAAELQVLQAIHGVGSVFNIAKEASGGIDRTSHAAIREHLDRSYGRSRAGTEGDTRPVLVTVFPGWPNVQMPADATAAGIDPMLMAEDERPKKASKSKTRKAETDETPADDTAFVE